MDISGQFVDFALLGQAWVLWLLVALSVLSVGVMIERALYFRRQKIDRATLDAKVREAIESDDTSALDQAFGGAAAMAARVALAGLAQRGGGVDAVAEAMNGEKMRVREEQEQNLVILGTLGNNAPFIGLFGTVLGIISALDRMKGAQGDIDAVGSDLSHALVATAVGIVVAIPAVVAFNLFQRRVRAEVAHTDALAHVVLSRLHRERGPKGKDPGEDPGKDQD